MNIRVTGLYILRETHLPENNNIVTIVDIVGDTIWYRYLLDKPSGVFTLHTDAFTNDFREW